MKTLFDNYIETSMNESETAARKRAPRNRTILLNDVEREKFRKGLFRANSSVSVEDIVNRTIHQDLFEVIEHLPEKFIDLVIADPPYNLNKTFNSTKFREMESEKYELWLESWIGRLVPLLKPMASIYICGDWRSSGAIFNVARKHFEIQNRITFEREKGRGAKSNWKNSSEDIWFCTKSKEYYFDTDSVKLKRKVLASYRDETGNAKDWQSEEEGKYRLTHPSNFWTDLTMPFWSMPENTDHPTQKPEKLVAKIILASSKPDSVVFDPFLGSGTTSVVAKKLGRKYVGVEIDEDYACIAEKRIELADGDKSIQGYTEGVFWERNAHKQQNI